MQRVVGGFVAKQVKDILLAPPKPPAEAGSADEAEVGPTEGEIEATAEADEGEFTDEEGRSLGMAYRLPGVAVWVVADRRGERWDELERCLAEPGARLFLQRERGRVTAIIYAADPTRPPRPRAEGLRADDV